MLLSSRLEGAREEKGRSLKHQYGCFYTDAMATGITELQNTIRGTCLMENVAHDVNILPKDMRADYALPQSDFTTRVLAAQWMVGRMLHWTADAIEDKFQSIISCPLGFLAGLTDVERLDFVPGEFEYDRDDGSIPFIFIATAMLPNVR